MNTRTRKYIVGHVWQSMLRTCTEFRYPPSRDEQSVTEDEMQIFHMSEYGHDNRGDPSDE